MLPQAPLKRPEAKKSWGGHPGTRNDFADGRSSQSSPPNESSGRPLAEIPPVRAATLFLLNAVFHLNTVPRLWIRQGCNEPQVACPAQRRCATSARNDSTNETMRTATPGFVTPPTGRRTRRISADEHDAIQARDARRRRVVQPTYCSEPSAILRSWRHMSSKFLQNESSAPRRRNARHYKMCLT
jgi:hypothetical protein